MGLLGRWQVTRNPSLEQRDEFRIHEPKVVRDVQADDSLSAKVSLEARCELGLVARLHDENEVCPCKKLGCHRDVRIRSQAGRSGLYARPVGEDLLGSRAAKAIATADEENVLDELTPLRPIA